MALQLDCAVVSLPSSHGAEVDELSATTGGVAQWVLANSGSSVWPEGTTLRLVGGPVLADPEVPVPPAAPGQTVIVDLHIWGEPPEEVSLAYALTTAEARLFGPLLRLQVSPRPPRSRLCRVLASPMDGLPGVMEAAPGEVKALQWSLANVGCAPWPDDAFVCLESASPSLQMGDAPVQVPSAQPGMAVEFCVSAALPSVPGRYSARWALTSESCPELRQCLAVEFAIPGGREATAELLGHSAVGELAAPVAPVGPTGSASTATVPELLLPEAPLDRELLASALERLRACEWERQEVCLRTLLRALRNAHAAPADPKFRRLPTSSKRLAEEVLAVPGGPELLMAVGFAEDADAFCLPPELALAGAGLRELEAFAQEAVMDRKRQERDERIRAEKGRKKNYCVNAARVDDDTKALLQRIQDDQADLAAKAEDAPTKASKAQLRTTWGAKVAGSGGDVTLNAKGGGALGGGQQGF